MLTYRREMSEVYESLGAEARQRKAEATIQRRLQVAGRMTMEGGNSHLLLLFV
ncbi:MAG TPA: hypothetical protein GXX18_17800 [Bacillales bacterium]|nr:hypothetical protein [Bacillales bacterium]